MHLDKHQAPRCRARSKRSGNQCRSPGVRGKQVCRMHGARGGAPIGNRNARKHGRYGREAIATRRELAQLVRRSLKLIEMV